MRRLRDVVVLLPGITGSVLQKDRKDVWGISPPAAWGVLTSLGSSFRDLLLQGDDPDVDDLGDGVRADRLMPSAHLLPGLVKIDGYSDMARLITANFKVQCGKFEIRQGEIHLDRPANFIEFPYDWRRDNRVAARLLKRTIKQLLPLWREYSGARDAKTILVAHSMGGLVARYYLEVLEGWRDCKALITFGTPYRGSLNALNVLAHGYKKLFLDLSEVMRSFTSVYQLLPIYKVVKIDGSYRRVAEVDSITGVARARARQALVFHRQIERAVKRHLKNDQYRGQGYRVVPVVGTRQLTLQSAELVGGRLAVNYELPEGIDELLGDGDGTVPRLSAIPIELSEEYRDTFLAERHASLQRNREALSGLRERLVQMQVQGLKKIRGPEAKPEAAERPSLSLEVDDLYASGEPVELRVRLVREHEGAIVNLSASAISPEARIERVEGTNAEAMTLPFRTEEEGWTLRLEGPPPGIYRCEVRAGAAGPWPPPSAVHDLFEVIG